MCLIKPSSERVVYHSTILNVMKKIIMSFAGVALFVAGYQYTRRQAKYASTQSALTNKPGYIETPAPAAASLKNSLAFKLVKSS